eukprot:TRINITY_DN6507_c0_g1_i1.p1 TRINITY_DN6507_c0_g1~~TRINITY_DN6507_c0_g1_i1.p1  ORF type:complete len:245 (+),score=115.94 TRINITY_DN6507_c0_g1_i1:85-819(+)
MSRNFDKKQIVEEAEYIPKSRSERIQLRQNAIAAAQLEAATAAAMKDLPKKSVSKVKGWEKKWVQTAPNMRVFKWVPAGKFSENNFVKEEQKAPSNVKVETKLAPKIITPSFTRDIKQESFLSHSSSSSNLMEETSQQSAIEEEDRPFKKVKTEDESNEMGLESTESPLEDENSRGDALDEMNMEMEQSDSDDENQSNAREGEENNDLEENQPKESGSTFEDESRDDYPESEKTNDNNEEDENE